MDCHEYENVADWLRSVVYCRTAPHLPNVWWIHGHGWPGHLHPKSLSQRPGLTPPSLRPWPARCAKLVPLACVKGSFANQVLLRLLVLDGVLAVRRASDRTSRKPSLSMRQLSVDGLSPRMAAAPPVPVMRPWVWCRTSPM